MNKAAIKSLTRVFLCTYTFISLRKYLGVELLGHRVCACFMINCSAFFQSGCTILHFHRQCMSSLAPHPVSCWCCQSFDFSYSGGCEVVAPGSFHFHCSHEQWCSSVMSCLTISICSLEVSVQNFCS